MISRRTELLQWIDTGAIKPDRIIQALEVTGVTPDASRWRRFLDQFLLVLGTLALACSVTFFIAHNWDALGHYAQFGLLQALMALAVLLWWRLGMHSLSAKLSLLLAALLLGTLLALYGQTYQTGADNWQLFGSWALLSLPWVLAGRFVGLWLLWLTLVNMATVLYFKLFPGLLWAGFNSGDDLLWLLLALNTAAWILWESASSRFEWLAHRWAVRLVAIASGTAMTSLVLFAIFEPGTMPILAFFVFVAWFSAVVLVYRRRLPDLFMLAGACLALIICLTCLLADFMLDGSNVAATFLLLALIVLLQAALAAAWLRRVHQDQTS